MYDRFEDPKHIYWAKKVKQRDRFTCQICGDTNTYLNSHHLMSWNRFVDQRFDVSNGITLCSDCHMHFHAVYGHGNNTKYQFKEYRKLVDIIKKIAYENK